MDEALSLEVGNEQGRTLSEIFKRERSRLLGFIRRRVTDRSDAEDIVQEVFYQLIESADVMRPLEHVSSWLYQTARNRIIDLFRRQQTRPEGHMVSSEESEFPLEEVLPSADAGPDDLYIRGVLLDELDAALEELPEEQRDVFVAHEMNGRSFQELANETGVNINTLLARKRYAVMYLRRRLDAIYREFINR